MAVLTYFIKHLKEKKLDTLEVELLPRFFRDWKEIIDDVYPILKLLIKLNSVKTSRDYSHRNILGERMRNLQNKTELDVKIS